MVDKWDYSAGNMLYNFNHIPNGERPFSLAAENIVQVKKLGNLDEDSVAYIQETLGILHESGMKSFLSLLIYHAYNNTRQFPGTPSNEAPRGDDKSDRWIYKLFAGS